MIADVGDDGSGSWSWSEWMDSIITAGEEDKEVIDSTREGRGR